MGLRFHGLRHAIAQDLYRKLAGVEPPFACGTPTSDQHRKACKIISKILGHNRWEITENYVGKL